MPIPSVPELMPNALGYAADTVPIPDTTPNGQGVPSYRDLFPFITQVDPDAGGIMVERAWMNALFKLLGQHAYFLQSGGVYPWNATLDYLPGSHVLGSNGTEYVAQAASGPDVPGVGAVDPVGDTTGTWRDAVPVYRKYELCELYSFRHPTLRPGFMAAQGGLIENAATLYPEAWAYLQTADGRLLCKTEAEWQAMSNAIYYTAADGTQEGWGGIGGAPFYVQDLNAGTLRLPDVRGMYPEAAGFNGLGVGGVHGDGMRQIAGAPNASVAGAAAHIEDGGLGVYRTTTAWGTNLGTGNTRVWVNWTLDSARAIPTSQAIRPRAYGVLACVYLGIPAAS